MDRKVRILLVGSLGVDDLLVRTTLERASFQASFGKTESVADLIKYLDQHHWDLIMLGLEGGFFRGLEVIRLLKQSHPNIPIIVISSDTDVTHVVAAMKAGADDYLLQENPDAILPSIESVLSIRESRIVPSPGDSSLPLWDQLAHSVTDLLYLYDVEYGTVLIQDAFGIIFENGEAALPLADAMKTLLLPADHRRLLRHWSKQNAQGAQIWNAFYSIQSSNGNFYPVEDRGYIERDEAGNPIRVVGVLMLGRIAAVRESGTTAMDQTGERYRILAEEIRDGVIVTDLDGRVLQANAASVRLLGISNDTDIAGVSIAEVLFQPCARMDLFEALNRTGYLDCEEVTRESTNESQAIRLGISATRHEREDAGWIGFILSDVTDLKAAQEALQMNERRLRGIVDTAHVVVLLLATDGTILEWNREAERISGVLRNEAIGENYIERFLPPEEIDRVKLDLALAARGKNAVGFESHIINRERGRRLVQWSVSALPGDAGDGVAVVAIGMDVTDTRRAEQALIANEANLSAVLENTEDSIWSIDTAYRVRAINSGFREKFHLLYGVELEPGMRILDFVPDPVRTFWLEHYTRALGGERFSTQAQFQWNKELRDYELSFNPLYEAKKITGVSIFARDITEQVKDASALKSHQQRDALISSISRSLLNNPIEQVHRSIESALSECAEFAHFDAAMFAVLAESPARTVEAMYEFNTQSMQERIQALFQPDGVCHWWQTIVRQFAPVAFKSLADLPDEARTEKAYLSSMGVTSGYILPLQAGDNRIGVLCCFTTESRREWGSEAETLCQTLGELIANALGRARVYDAIIAERALLAGKVEEHTAELRALHAEFTRATRMKDEFLANLSHELRSPLAAIVGLTESLRDQMADQSTQKQRNALDVIDESGKRLLSLINDIVDLANIEAGRLTMQLESHGVDLICKSSMLFIRQMAMNKGVQVDYRNPEPKLTIDTDGARLKQALVKLLNNAVECTPEGGSVTLSVKPRESRNEVVFAVSDAGMGFEEEQMARLFKPFLHPDNERSRHDEGSGLGLSLVASIADMLGGSVALESAAGKGRTITMALPLKQTGLRASASTLNPMAGQPVRHTNH